MAEVGIFEAKNRLSELVERAARGEEIVITRRGEPVALLMPPRVPEHLLGEIDLNEYDDHDLAFPIELMRFANPSWHSLPFAADRG